MHLKKEKKMDLNDSKKPHQKQIVRVQGNSLVIPTEKEKLSKVTKHLFVQRYRTCINNVHTYVSFLFRIYFYELIVSSPGSFIIKC